MNEQEKLEEMSERNEGEYYYPDIERHEMQKFVPLNAERIFEVGCGYGGFGRALKSRQPLEYWAVELNNEATLIASKKLDKVINGIFNRDLDIPRGYFDCIIFNDVLEHMVDPYNALNFSKELLRESGVVVASIPNIRHFDVMYELLLKKRWEYQDTGILDKTHLRFFTQTSIVNMFQNQGFTISELEGIGEEWLYRKEKFKFLNLLLMNKINDMKYLQFAVVAKPCNQKHNKNSDKS